MATRYVAWLRGVSPMNCKMADLKACVEAGGYANVKTLLSSGNVAFDVARKTAEPALEKKLEALMEQHLGRGFYTVVRSTQALQQLIADDPFADFKLPPAAKRVVSFLREAPATQPLDLPLRLSKASILAVRGREILSAYEPGDDSPVFMTLIEKTFGRDITTRTWDTVRKASLA